MITISALKSIIIIRFSIFSILRTLRIIPHLMLIESEERAIGVTFVATSTSTWGSYWRVACSGTDKTSALWSPTSTWTSSVRSFLFSNCNFCLSFMTLLNWSSEDSTESSEECSSLLSTESSFPVTRLSGDPGSDSWNRKRKKI